jgi:hypothetical protein
MSAAFIGLDLAKSVFQVHGVDLHGKVVVMKRASCRNQGAPGCSARHHVLSGLRLSAEQPEETVGR